ncbi:MAG: Holliday junction resolvase RuvX [Candidatus Zixiibacteriota bacterium]|nr:MAG: Holliday junction resolvase RuvX [candidate division Zixibacteria bacterium]
MTDRPRRELIAIDYGSRRIGLAKSDPTGTIASALITLEVKSAADAVRQLSRVIEQYQPDGLIIGYPLMPSGDKSDKCREIDRFVEKLRKVYDGPIEKVDERHSTSEAADIIHAHGRRIGQDKKRLDRLAAVIVLQRYLDEHPRP